MNEFKAWPKIPRLLHDTFTITEKLDGTNGQILITEDGELLVGSRTRWLSEDEDNQGFYQWVMERKESLLTVLSPGRYYGEFIGKGIQRGYGLKYRRFYLFYPPKDVCNEGLKALEEAGVYVIPTIRTSLLLNLTDSSLVVYTKLFTCGSLAVPGFMKPEGFIVSSSKTNAKWKFYVYEKV